MAKKTVCQQVVTFKVRPEVAEKLRKLAAAEDRTLSSLIRNRINLSLANAKKQEATA